MSRDAIVADTSCLIVLQNIRELSLLQKLFGEVIITEEVKEEFGLPLPEWIKIRSAANISKKESLNLFLDKGEASSIALSLENDNSLLIIDEKKGRRIAQELGLRTIGTIGIILEAKTKGLIDPSEDMAGKLESAGFHLSPALKVRISAIQ